MTANWFEAKVKYIKVNEDGREKKVTESYLFGCDVLYGGGESNNEGNGVGD